MTISLYFEVPTGTYVYKSIFSQFYCRSISALAISKSVFLSNYFDVSEFRSYSRHTCKNIYTDCSNMYDEMSIIYLAVCRGKAGVDNLTVKNRYFL